MYETETFSEEETFTLAGRLAAAAQPGQVYALNGDLGAGKTVFAKGFAAGLGIDEPVSSPTFTLIHEYEGGRLALYHFDVYRIGDPDEMYELGYEDYFYGSGVTLVEWACLIAELLPPDVITVTMERVPDAEPDHRRIRIAGLAQGQDIMKDETYL